jgi:hypothetical protein
MSDLKYIFTIFHSPSFALYLKKKRASSQGFMSRYDGRSARFPDKIPPGFNYGRPSQLVHYPG